MKRLLLIISLLLFTTNLYAGTVTQSKIYATNDQVTASNLNSNLQVPIVEINGNLNNENANTSSGFRFYEALGSTPSAGTDGRFVYNTANDEASFDNGTNFLPIANASLNNLASVAINTSLISDTNNTDDLGSTAIKWKDLFLSNAASADTVRARNLRTETYTFPESTFRPNSLLKVDSDGNLSFSSTTIIDNVGTTNGLKVNQNAVLDASNHAIFVTSSQVHTTADTALLKVVQDNVNATEPAIEARQDGPAAAFEASVAASDAMGLLVTVSTSSRSHLVLTPISSISGNTEGDLYADDDGILYYRNNSAFAACNAAGDFAELMTSEGVWSDYEDGDVIVLAANLKVKKSSVKYDKAFIGILNETKGPFKIDRTNRPYVFDKKRKDKALKKSINARNKYEKRNLLQEGKTFEQINKNTVQVSLIGLVDCKVNDEGGDIAIGDLLTSSSTSGIAMKANPTTFDQMSAIIGKARENINFTSVVKTGKIAILVGVK